MWQSLRTAFNLPIPNVCITMGFPSRRARSRASNRAPGEILVQEWKGSQVEKALVSIHPERFEDIQQVARAVLFVIGNEVYGSRRNLGSTTLGIQIDKQSGDLTYTNDEKGKHASHTLNAIVHQLGALPQGFTEMPEPKSIQRTKAQKYTCPTCKTNIRAAVQIQALCMHFGKPEFGQAPMQFALQLPKAQQPAATQQPKATAPAVPAPTEEENIANVIDAVKKGAAKIIHGSSGRNFGMEATS